ncbi:Xre family DNA-binding protein [Mycolicibacterium rhodesiae JS60]|nr:Xre family DNA-binding protein [Mycolicibacterium rhodesiae JS60]
MAPNERETASLAVVVGANCKRIRTDAGVTQNVLARHARDAGLRWTTSKVGQFERGQYTPAFTTVLAAVSALSAATRTDVQLADLVSYDGFVVLTDTLDPDGSVLQALIRGEREWNTLRVEEVGYFSKISADPSFGAKLVEGGLKAIPTRYRDVPLDQLVDIQRRSGLDEERVAKRLDVNLDVLSLASWTLWRRSFSDERDSRAGTETNAQKRGRISRTLQDELREELARGDDK